MTLIERLKGGPRTLEDAEDAERAVVEKQVREARLQYARGCRRWQEIGDDLVPRAGGRLFVGAATDRVYRAYPGTVFAPHSADAIADQSALSYVVTSSGGLVFYEEQRETWTEQLERRAARKLQPRRRLRKP
jgi:hypothetical protein